MPRVGERAAHVAEHLALEERRRDAAEIHFDERPRLTPAVAMDRFRHQLLAGAALAGDQHRRIGRGDAPHQLQDAQQPRIFAHQVAEVVLAVQLLARRHALVGLRARRGEAERGLHGLEDLLVGPGLGDEVGRAGLHAFHRELDRSPRGDQDHGQRRPQRLELADQREPFLARRAAREVHVLDHQLARILAHPLQRLRRRAHRMRRVARLLQQQRQRGGHGAVVVNDQDHGYGIAVRHS